jgi:hypothetical protein
VPSAIPSIVKAARNGWRVMLRSIITARAGAGRHGWENTGGSRRRNRTGAGGCMAMAGGSFATSRKARPAPRTAAARLNTAASDIEVRAAGKDQKREGEIVGVEAGDVAPSRVPGRAADGDADDGDSDDELDVMAGDSEVAVADRLHEPDLFALQRHQPGHRHIDQEGSDKKKDRRQRAAHVAQHVEHMVEPGMRCLILAAVGGPPAIALEKPVEAADHLRARRRRARA